ncbi:hypothetical protein JHK87_011942 [Glycine soja]|nr:hypothetical protein JHK87_011942 [Glycine soja]
MALQIAEALGYGGFVRMLVDALGHVAEGEHVEEMKKMGFGSEQEEDSGGVHIEVLRGGDYGEDCGGGVGVEVLCGEGQGLQDPTAGCGGGEEGEADGHGGGVQGGAGGHFRDEDNGRGGLLLQPVPQTDLHRFIF